MIKERMISIVRSLIQVIGALMMFTSIPFLTDLLEALNFIETNIDQAFDAVTMLIGIATALYGFFFDPVRSTNWIQVSSKRFEDRVVGLQVNGSTRSVILNSV